MHSKLFLYLVLADLVSPTPDAPAPAPANAAASVSVAVEARDGFVSPTPVTPAPAPAPAPASAALKARYAFVWVVDFDVALGSFSLQSHLSTLARAQFHSGMGRRGGMGRGGSGVGGGKGRNDIDGASPPFAPLPVLVSQPLIAGDVQKYRYLNNADWARGLRSYLRRTGTKAAPPCTVSVLRHHGWQVKPRKPTDLPPGHPAMPTLVAAETGFIEVQAPVFEAHFLTWWVRFLVTPLLGAAHVLGADWGVDALFCRAARMYASEYYRRRGVGGGWVVWV